MNPEGIPYFSPGFPNPGSAALALDFNPEWVAYKRAENAQDATLSGLTIEGLTLLPRVRKPWAGIRNPVGIDLAWSDGIHFPSFRCPGRTEPTRVG